MIKFSTDLYQTYIVNRKRYIPDEIISLTNDTIYYVSDELIVTGWRAIRTRPDISGGCISELSFVGKNINFTDLLIDLVVYPDNSIRILDLDEFAEAVEKNYITKEQEVRALNSFHALLDYIYNDEYSLLQEPIYALEEYLSSLSY